MRHYKLMVVAVLTAVLFASCKKDHYDVSNVHGIHAEGGVLLPIGSKSLSMMDMMERFHLDSLITCTDDGSLFYTYTYEGNNVVDGDSLLRFNNLDYNEHIAFPNPFVFNMPSILDTVVSFDMPLQFESDYIGVLEAWMRSGRFDFDISTNIGIMRHVVLRSPDIKDDQGNDLRLEFPLSDGTFSVDIGGLRYETDEANKITLGFDIAMDLAWSDDPELYIDLDIKGRDFCIREMMGYVHTFVSQGSIDTTFHLFPSNLTGTLDIKDARLRISERNLFGIATRLEVDTAVVYADGIPPYSLLDPLPLYVTIPTQMQFGEVFNRPISGTIEAHGGKAHATYQFVINPFGVTDIVSVADTCAIDVQVGVDIPFAFKVTDVQYLDTVELAMNEIEMPDMIKKLTLDLSLTSTLPLNLDGWFYLYDSQADMITDILNPDGQLIVASYDGQPTSTMVSIEITEDRLENLFRADRIITRLALDTDARDVKLNANQRLGLSIKAKVEYDGNVELENN